MVLVLITVYSETVKGVWGLLLRRRDEMLLEVASPVRSWSTGTTPCTQLQWSFQVTEFHSKPRERCECVDDESAPVAGVVVALVGIWPYLDHTIDADRVNDPFVRPPSVGFAQIRAGECIAEGTSGEGLLHLRSLLTGVASGRPPALEDS